jgi:hypothetical protein
MCDDRRDNEAAFSAELEAGGEGGDLLRGSLGLTVVAARRETGRLPRGIDTPHLHRDRGETGHAEHQNDHQCGDGESRLDGAGTAVASQTLVFSARLMMFVSAVTIESPVTTV